MTDNFDSNVARRKPNTASRRPVLPWDVPKTSVVEDVVEQREPDSIPAAPIQELSSPLPESPEIISPPLAPLSVPAEATVRLHSQQRITPVVNAPVVLTDFSRARKNDLSDSINIHSNYCKLDNDVSDHLLQKLSASAQAVYLRLYRQSFGWNRNWAAESLPKLVEYCNLSLQTVRKAIKELEVLGCIKKEFSDYHKATVYRIYLPSEIGLGKNNNTLSAGAISRGLNNNIPKLPDSLQQSQDSLHSNMSGQNSERDVSYTGEYQFFEDQSSDSGGQVSYIQSVYFSGINIYNIFESGSPLPKNILIYITDIHLSSAVNIIDEFYDSIGFSIVSRSLYRKSLLDFFELIKSGFSADDIRYAVRWTFKNSRSRPDSFSLIKHTMHLAMSDLIQELKQVSGEKEAIQEKQEAIQKNMEWKSQAAARPVSAEEMGMWIHVVEDLRNTLNEHSFSAFIEPLRLDAVDEDRILLSAPPDSVSWVNDHYVERIRECYFERTGRTVKVEVR